MQPGQSKGTVRQVLGKYAFKPHLRQMWCIPPKQSAEFVRNMEDVLDVSCQPAEAKRIADKLEIHHTRKHGS